MEIKIHCACGRKYSFDVEPVNGRMPVPVSCPVCGLDGTGQANAIIQERLEPATAGVAAGSAGYSHESVPVGRLLTVEPAQQTASPRVATARTGPSTTPRAVSILAAGAPAPKSSGRLKTILSTCVVLAVVGFGLWRFGAKWYRRISAVAHAVQAATGSDEAGSSNRNLWQEDSVVLFIKHTNHLEIADVCKEYWKSQLQKTLTVTESADDEIEEGEYCLFPAYNGYVRMLGGLKWPQPQYEGLARHFSQRFGTLVFETRDVDFSGAYHFGVYESGARKFHAQMEVSIVDNDVQEKLRLKATSGHWRTDSNPARKVSMGFTLAMETRSPAIWGCDVGSTGEPEPARAGAQRTAELSSYRAFRLAMAQGLGQRSILANISADQTPSIRLHEKFGFEKVAHLRQVGRKFNQWFDGVYLQLLLSRRWRLSPHSPTTAVVPLLRPAVDQHLAGLFPGDRAVEQAQVAAR